MSNPYDYGEKRKTSILGPTLKFKGELTANEDLLIQGQIEGSIHHTSNLTIGPEGKLKANIKAEHIAVEGRIEGDLEGSTSVVVKETANVTGNIYSPTVTLREGSTFNGRIDMSGKKKAEDAPKPAAEDDIDSPDTGEAERSTRKSSSDRKRSANVA